VEGRAGNVSENFPYNLGFGVEMLCRNVSKNIPYNLGLGVQIFSFFEYMLSPYFILWLQRMNCGDRFLWKTSL